MTTEQISELLCFLRDNYGVLVTNAANRKFCCQDCGAQDVFASNIRHTDQCRFKPLSGRK